MRYVLDCNVALKWFVPEEHSDRALRILQGFQQRTIELIAPDSILAEFGHSVRRVVLGGRVERERARRILTYFLDLPIEATPSRVLAPAALDLALTQAATFYDALYIALAEREGLKVLTADDRMASAFSRLGRTVLLRDFAS